MELTHHKVTISGGLFELYDNKTAIGLNGSTYSASSVTADQKGSLAITGGVFVHNGTLLDTKLNDYFTSVTLDDAISYYHPNASPLKIITEQLANKANILRNNRKSCEMNQHLFKKL